jgi:hypothetical protein
MFHLMTLHSVSFAFSFLFFPFLRFHLQLAQVSDAKVLPATAMNGELPQKSHPLNLLQVKFVMAAPFVLPFF